MWEIPKIWGGEQCIIIGGGPSIVEQFNIPADVVQSVYKKQCSPDVYSPYMKAIHNEHVIAVNMAFKLGPWVDMLFFGDKGFFKRTQEEIFAFKGLRATCARGVTEYGGRIKVLEQNKKKRGIEFSPTSICWNFNSGSAAINLAVHLGVKKIILLGFDMQVDKQKNQHWHKFYQGNKKTVGGTMNMHLKSFPIIAEDLKGKVEVINASPNSRIECFPKMSIEEALKK